METVGVVLRAVIINWKWEIEVKSRTRVQLPQETLFDARAFSDSQGS